MELLNGSASFELVVFCNFLGNKLPPQGGLPCGTGFAVLDLP